MYYHAFGLNIFSEIVCPMISGNADAPIDVRITLGKVPEKLAGEGEYSDWCQANRDQLLLKISDVANFLVEKGSRIWVEPLCDNMDDVCLFLLGSAIGGLLQQRGYLVIHANGIIINDSAVLIMAEKGYGKSTLAAAFFKRGYNLLADDVCAIDIKNNAAIVYPSYPHIKLCPNVLSHLGYMENELKPIGNIAEKYYLPIREKLYQNSARISHLIVLDKTEAQDCKFEEVSGFEKMKALFNNTYRQNFVVRQGLTSDHFKQCEKLLNLVQIRKLYRPESGFSAFDLVSTIESNLFQNEICI